MSAKLIKSTYYHLRPYLAFAKLVILQANGDVVKTKSWIATTNQGPKVICQNGYICETCQSKAEDGKSEDGFLACMMCGFKCWCHAEMIGHVDHENHYSYF